MTAKLASRELDQPTEFDQPTETDQSDAHRIAAVEVARHGALIRADAMRILGPTGLATALEDREWVEPWSGVVVPAHREHDPHTRAAAALLRAGSASVLSGTTAAAMHGCTAAESATIEVTVPYDRQMRPLPGLSVRQAWIQEYEVLELDGLRAHALDVAITELLCTGPQRVALACLEQALAGLPASRVDHFRALIGTRIARRRDRRGTRRAVALLDLAWANPPHASATEPGCVRASSSTTPS